MKYTTNSQPKKKLKPMPIFYCCTWKHNLLSLLLSHYDIHVIINSNIWSYTWLWSWTLAQDIDHITPCHHRNICPATLDVLVLLRSHVYLWMIWHRFSSTIQMVKGTQQFRRCAKCCIGKLLNCSPAEYERTAVVYQRWQKHIGRICW